MALKLRVISDHYKQLGKAGSRMFGVHGGRIGRAPDNDWVLPDPERYVSSHHASVQFRGGKWILEDTSTNGVFVNDSSTPISVNGPYQMHEGDRLRFGDYEFIVSIDNRNDFPADASGQMPAPPAVRQRTTSAKRVVGQSRDEGRFADLGADLDISDLLGGSDDQGGEPTLPGYSVEESSIEGRGYDAKPARAPTLTAGKNTSAPSLLDDILADSLPSGTGPGKVSDDWHMATRRLAKREPTAVAAVSPAPLVSPPQPMRVEVDRQRRAAPPNEFLGDGGTAVDAFCRGAGIDSAAIPTESNTALFTLAGQMLREVVLSLMESLKNRADQKDRFRISKTSIQSNNNNPLKFSASVEEALRKLLDSHNTRYLGPVDALRDAFGDLKNHQLAVDAAMQVALDDLLFRLEPSELQERFDRGLKRGPLLAAVNKTKYWDLYTEFYPLLNQRDTRGLPAVFTEEFNRIYGEKIAELENGRKK
jgi:type VI secretion system protein